MLTNYQFNPVASLIKTESLLNLGTKFAYGTANCIKRFGLGLASSAVITPTVVAVTSFFIEGGVINDFNDHMGLTFINIKLNTLQKQGFKRFNVEKIAQAACYWQEFTEQYNAHIPFMRNRPFTPFMMKAITTVEMCLVTSLLEEIVCRGLIQDVLLTKLPKCIIKKFAPGKEAALDSTTAKVARILLTAALFSASHLSNKGLLSDAYVNGQLVATFVMGLGFGIVKESEAGLLGTVAAHLAHNFAALYPTLLDC